MKRIVWAIWVTVSVAMAASPALAQVDSPAKRDQVAAATAKAVDHLRSQIAGEELGKGITVGDLVDATGGNDFLVKTLQRSQMIGGPRWLDNQTCQVRLEISGPRVANALVQIASLNAKKSPIAPEVLSGRLRTWDTRTFSATSTSTDAAVLENLRPAENPPAWANVNDKARHQAIAAAKRNAGGNVILAMGPIPLANGKNVSDAMSDASVKSAVEKWLLSRPVTAVQFHDDLQLEVTISTPGGELADVFLDAVAATKPPIVALDDVSRAKVRQAFISEVPGSPHGTARAGETNAAAKPVALPAVPPAWANDQMDADGSAPAVKASALKTGRAAEADAQVQLRKKLDALELTPGVSLSQAAKQDLRIAEAVDKVVARARASKVDYQSDGSARVRLSVDLHELWDALTPD